MISKEQVQESALTLFTRYGLKSVNMDDLAKELRVSKKTIYQVYNSKEELVLSLFERISKEWNKEVELLLKKPSNPIRQFLELTALRYQYVERLNPTFLLKSSRQYQKVYTFMLDITNSIEALILDLLNQAKEKKMILEEVDPGIFYKVHQSIFDAYFEHYNPVVPGSENTFKHMVIAPIAGICNNHEINVWEEFNSITAH
tara:strand:- start:109 stop:711 length:603 start_codon:yes stop_codon:yes gene_type:complete